MTASHCLPDRDPSPHSWIDTIGAKSSIPDFVNNRAVGLIDYNSEFADDACVLSEALRVLLGSGDALEGKVKKDSDSLQTIRQKEQAIPAKQQ